MYITQLDSVLAMHMPMILHHALMTTGYHHTCISFYIDWSSAKFLTGVQVDEVDVDETVAYRHVSGS